MSSSIKERRRMQNEELKEDLDYILNDLWGIHPQDPFRCTFTSKIKRSILGGFVHLWIGAPIEELMIEFNVCECQARNMRIFMIFFYYSQVKGHRSPRTPRVSKQDYLNFTSDPSLWLCIDNCFRCELQHYLHSPMPNPKEFDYIESSSMSSASSIEDDLEHEEEINSIDDSFQGSVASHHGEPTLKSLFRATLREGSYLHPSLPTTNGEH